jgi:hypothetical protein
MDIQHLAVVAEVMGRPVAQSHKPLRVTTHVLAPILVLAVFAKVLKSLLEVWIVVV